MTDTDVIVVGAGLAGLVATAELAAAGRRVVLVDQEPEAHLGGQAYWSSGGLFLVNSPEQRRSGLRDSVDLAWQDWLGAAGYDLPHDDLARQWAEGYVAFAAGEKRAWLRRLGVRFLPAVGWAERGGGLATGHGNSVPRFHLVWGTGPALVAPFVRLVREGVAQGLVRPLFRHRVDELTTTGDTVDGVRGAVLEPANGPRGVPTSRVTVGEFALRAQAVLVTSGGMGADHDLVRQHWPRHRYPPPRHLLSGVPDHVDGRMLGIAEKAGAHLTNLDRMWHYPEGLHHWDPLWTNHGVRLLPGPSALWCDATGHRLPAPNFPGYDSLATLTAVLRSGHDHSWLVLNRRILNHELMLSGSEQNPDLTGQSVLRLLANALPNTPRPLREFLRHGSDFVTAPSVPELAASMDELTRTPLVDAAALEREVHARDRAATARYTKDSQVLGMREARRYLGERLMRTTRPHRLLDPAAGPLVAVRLHVLSRKTLGGLRTDLTGRVLDRTGTPVPGLHAAGEAAGFGGGGLHGHRSLEGTFLGACLHTGRQAGRTLASAVH